MRVTSKGQVTIPQRIRERHGYLPGTEVEFVEVDGRVEVRKIEGGGSRGRDLVAHLRGRATSGMSTEEILSLTRPEE